MRKIINGLLSIGILLVAIIFLASCGGRGKNNSATTSTRYIDSARTIKVVQIDGTATVSDESDTLSCFKGMNLYDGDKLNIGDDSIVVVRFDDDKYVYLGENTEVDIKSSGDDKFKTNVFVSKGLVLAEIQNKLGEDEEFFLSSNNSVMAVRGTVFGVKVVETADSFIETYSVYRGVTELFVFDNNNGNLLSGKLTDISNSKIELTVPKTHLVDDSEFEDILGTWLTDVSDEFESSNDANNKLSDVEIAESTPSADDYKQVIDTIGNNDVATYSSLSYETAGYFGPYDGQAHKITVDVETEGATVTYSNSLDGTYSTENTFEYTEPGSYRVYYKIECEGYDTKIDYEVIQITKVDLTIDKSSDLGDNLNGYLAGTDADTVFNYFDLADYYTISGLAIHSEEIAKATFSIDGTLENGTNTYTVNINLPDTIKSIYGNTTIELEITAGNIELDRANGINNGNIIIDSYASQTIYNEILLEFLMSNPSFTYPNGLKSNLYIDDKIDFTYSCNSITDGYIKLVNGMNTITMNVTLLNGEKYDLVVEAYYNEVREEADIQIATESENMTSLGGDNYWYKATEEADLDISLADLFKLLTVTTNAGGEYYINIDAVASYLDTVDYSEYTSSSETMFTLGINKNNEFTIVCYPTGINLFTTKTINIYYALAEPTNYPEFTISETLAFNYYSTGTDISFITSDTTVKYSLDGESYSETLTVTEPGKYKVYYQVGTDIVVGGYEIITVETGEITSDNMSIILKPIPLFTTDGEVISYSVTVSNETLENQTIKSNVTISDKEETYTVFRDMMLYSDYYDSVTGEYIDVNVEVSDYVDGNPGFTYTLSAYGYEDVTGEVTFTYSKITSINASDQTSLEVEFYDASDLTLSPNDFSYVEPTRVRLLNLESYLSYTVYYSINGGATWTTEIPKITTEGLNTVYSMYVFTDINAMNAELGDMTLNVTGLDLYGNYIISIQHIYLIK